MSSDLETEPGSQVVVAQAEAVTSYNEEAETFAVQHRVNKLKQHHRRWVGGIVTLHCYCYCYCYHHCRAFELISRALKIDEEQGNKDGATVELYKKGTPLSPGFGRDQCNCCVQASRSWSAASAWSLPARGRGPG